MWWLPDAGKGWVGQCLPFSHLLWKRGSVPLEAHQSGRWRSLSSRGPGLVWQQLVAATCWPGRAGARDGPHRSPPSPAVPVRGWWGREWRPGCLHKAGAPGDKCKVSHLGKGGMCLSVNAAISEGWAGLAVGCCELGGYQVDPGGDQVWCGKFGWCIAAALNATAKKYCQTACLPFNASL